MKSLLYLWLFAVLILNINAGVHSKTGPIVITSKHHRLAHVKIYSNLAEVIQPIDRLPVEFSAEDWYNIRSDSLTLVGSNVNITEQTITEKKKSVNNHHVYVRSPLSSNKKVKFLKATMIDEDKNLVKIIDNDISKEPIFFTVPSDQIFYTVKPSQSKYYVNFKYNATDTVYLSYLRSNLNWKTRYQLHLFETSESPIFIVMADIRNDGKSKIDIESAELFGGDINLQVVERQRWVDHEDTPMAHMMLTDSSSIEQGQEVAGLYAFTINQPFSIDAKTNYLLAMFRPQVTVERFGLIYKNYFSGVGKSTGKAQRTYRLSSDRFLSHGNCMIREYDHLVGETYLPNLAAKDKYEFSIGEDSDIVHKQNVTLVSSRIYNETIQLNNKIEQRTQSIYNVNVLLKNFKINRSVKIEFKQTIWGRSIKLVKSNGEFTQDDTTIQCETVLIPDEEKLLSYNVEIIN